MQMNKESSSTANELDPDACRSCGEIVGKKDKGLQCDDCNMWFHNSCEEVTDGEYSMIVKLGHKIEWKCNKCKIDNSNYFQNLKDLKEQITVANKDIDTLQKKIEANDEIIEKSPLLEETVIFENKFKSFIEQIEEKMTAKLDDIKENLAKD